MNEKYKNYKFSIYKIKQNEQIIKNRFYYDYVEEFIKNNENIIYKYDAYYNKFYKKFFYYDKKSNKYKPYYQIMKHNTKNKYLLEDINKNKYRLKFNNIENIESFIRLNMSSERLRKYTLIRLDNDYFIIYKEFIL